ncbi:MAG: bifunctional adenosylcobinamide kinase/adenosylcobinamide-phosphate guanylyltransferase [Fibrobacteres bacterium]|nr:bifunctional adenosylcobinamide kinase/adenosylcobinamide-phosphate guanylyltransferase [Fibrobacterota bacterium]
MPVMLYTGGVRSGKSTLALNNAAASKSERKIFFATAVAFDDEMKSRIEKHKLERHEMRFDTIEVPYTLSDSLKRENGNHTAVVDCLTVWLSNQYYKSGEEADSKVMGAVEELVTAMSKSSMELHVVTNELGWSIVPENAFARRFRDMAGYLNRRVAEIASNVTMCVCGIPVKIK